MNSEKIEKMLIILAVCFAEFSVYIEIREVGRKSLFIETKRIIIVEEKEEVK